VGDSSTAAAIVAPLSIAQRCDHDSLSGVFSFSQHLIDVVAAAQTCHSWRAVASLRQSSCRAKVHLGGDKRADFLQMLESPLRVHLTKLYFGDARGHDLLQLHDRCSQLEGLTIRVNGASIVALTDSAAAASAFNAHAWPSSLRSLKILMRAVNSIGLQPLLNALPSTAIGLQSLKVHIPGDETVLDLTPLLRLPELTSLRVYPALLWPSQLAVVRQLRSLTALDLVGHGWNPRDLLALLADGSHQLQCLKKINIEPATLDVELMQALLTLPNLTELEPRSVALVSVPLLRSFVKLRKLRLLPPSVDNAAVVELLSSLRALSELTSLVVGGFEGEPTVVKSLMDGLGTAVPQLRELTLCYFDALPPLTALSACTQLRALRLTECERAHSQSLDDVLQLIVSLPHLESVEVDARCSLPPLTAAQRMQFTPPSAMAPALKTFDWHSC
jgi:hypothetical protein